jgi:uncharacterized membrane protein
MDDFIIKPESPNNFFIRLHPGQRLIIALLIAIFFYFFIRNVQLHPLIQVLYIWDVFALVVLSLSWIVFWRRSVGQIRQFARKDDGSLVYIFSLVILASFGCLFSLVLLFITREKISNSEFIFLLAVLPAMVFSWLMIHTTFAFDYAHMYYDDLQDDTTRHAGGLNFPSEKKPDYLDFAYFSFVVGMTFQVSDVTISSRKIRRIVLMHALISFVFNTFIVALTINLIAALKH